MGVGRAVIGGFTIPEVIPFPPVPAGDPIKISATTYIAFRQCPAQAEARFQGVYPPESKQSFLGAVAHRIFARHLTSGPIEDLPQAIREEIGTGLNPKLVALGIHRPSELEELIRTMGSLYERFRRFPSDGFESAEVSLEAEPANGVLLIGKIDAVFNDGSRAPLLRDWKTGSLGEPMDQLMFYALVWALARNEVPGVIEAVSLQTGERMRSQPTVATLTQVAAQVAELVTAVRQNWASGEAAQLRGGPWCRYCPLLPDCPEGSVAFAVNE